MRVDECEIVFGAIYVMYFANFMLLFCKICEMLNFGNDIVYI